MEGVCEVVKMMQREDNRAESTTLDYKEVVDNYVKVEDWRVKDNSTVTYSVGGLILSNSGAVTANYWLSEIYDDEIANPYVEDDFDVLSLSISEDLTVLQIRFPGKRTQQLRF